MRKKNKEKKIIKGVKENLGDGGTPPSPPAALAARLDAELRSAHLDLRLVGFEAAQSSACRCRLGDAVAAAHSFKLALTHHLHRHPDLPVVGSFSRAARATNRRSESCKLWQEQSLHSAAAWLSYLNLAVSGSISSSSLTGERGTLAENFSVRKSGKLIPSVLPHHHHHHHQGEELTYEWPHHGIINLPHGFQRHPAVHVNGSCQRLKDVSHGLWHLDVFLLFLVFFRATKLRTVTAVCFRRCQRF